MVWAKVMPSAEAADTWPLETLWRPARMISEEYAASNRGKPTSTEAKRVSVLGPSPSTVRKSWGTMRKNQSSTITSGTERNRLTYPAAKTASGFSGESRIIASSVPQTMPAATATKVNSSESTIPFQRNGSAPGIELQSISYIAAPFRLAIGGADEPWNAGVLLHLPHDQHDRNVDDQIEDRDRDERFVGLRSVVDELAPLCSQLEQADGRADRRVFEGIEHFGSERRHDEPTGHRQEHVTVGLGKCEPQRQGGVLLTARERVDAGAHLLADARAGEQRQADHRSEELLQHRIELLEALPAREQLRHHGGPDEELRQERHVAERLDVDGGDGPQRAAGHRAQDAHRGAQREREDPRDCRQEQRHPQPGEEPPQKGGLPSGDGLREHQPIPVVSHAGGRSPP